MSEFINNREFKQKKLKEIILKLHDGVSVEEVQEEFRALSVGVSAAEIAEMEQALVNEGMPVENIQKLCDVHASVFKGSIEDIHAEEGLVIPGFDEGHPVHTFKAENRIIETLLENEVLRHLSEYTETKSKNSKQSLASGIDKLQTIDKHYKRKENLLFPYMEQYEITAPPQVMWGVDDEIREAIKIVKNILDKETADMQLLNSHVRALVVKVNEMIFKEEEIMFPMILDTFSFEEWIAIEKASAEIGYTLLHAVKRWLPENAPKVDSLNAPISRKEVSELGIKDILSGAVAKDSDAVINFDAGSLTSEEINSILNTLPLDMTFVDADNRVKYFTQGKERIFDRPITIIGREVKHCHPPKSVHIVEQIVEDLRSGKKDNEDFWIKMGQVFVYIRYFAVRSKQGKFLGTLELSQNIKAIMELEGEKRLMSD